MDDAQIAELFAQPQNLEQRRYEILRAVFVDQRPQQDVAGQFGVSYDTVRRLVCDCRRDVRHGASPFCFVPAAEDAPATPATNPTR